MQLFRTNGSNFFSTHGENAFYLEICHSEAAIVVRNGLCGFPSELRNRIIVVAISPAGYISRKLCHEVYHYVSKRDFVPFFDPFGLIECWDTVYFLDPHVDAPIWDHDYRSPTFKDPLKYRIDVFIENHGGFK